MKKSHLFLLLLTVLLFACTGKESGEISISKNFDAESLLQKAGNLPKVISKEEIAGIVRQKPENMEVYYENYDADPAKHTLSFHWLNGKSKTIETLDGQAHKLESRSALGIAFIRKISAEDFEKSFSKQGVQQAVDKLVSDTSLSPDIAIAEAKYLAESAQKRSFEKTETPGLTTFWETPNYALHLFAGGVAFTVTVNMGEDESENKKQAVKLAEMIINLHSTL